MSSESVVNIDSFYKDTDDFSLYCVPKDKLTILDYIAGYASRKDLRNNIGRL